MRQIVIDMEISGLHAQRGHRVIEFCAVELVDRHITGDIFHAYINPESASDSAAVAIHRLHTEFLADKPTFAAVVDRVMAFVRGDGVILHNAPFDLGFLDAEYARLRLRPFADTVTCITDTLEIARRKFPGESNSLDALYKRFGLAPIMEAAECTKNEALRLAQAYLALTR